MPVHATEQTRCATLGQRGRCAVAGATTSRGLTLCASVRQTALQHLLQPQLFPLPHSCAQFPLQDVLQAASQASESLSVPGPSLPLISTAAAAPAVTQAMASSEADATSGLIAHRAAAGESSSGTIAEAEAACTAAEAAEAQAEVAYTALQKARAAEQAAVAAHAALKDAGLLQLLPAAETAIKEAGASAEVCLVMRLLCAFASVMLCGGLIAMWFEDHCLVTRIHRCNGKVAGVLQVRANEHTDLLAQARAAAGKAEAACCQAEQHFTNISQQALACGKRNLVHLSQLRAGHPRRADLGSFAGRAPACSTLASRVLALGLLSTADLQQGAVQAGMDGAWYSMGDMAGAGPDASCAAQLPERHTAHQTASTHADVRHVQGLALAQHQAFAACLPALQQRLLDLQHMGMSLTHPQSNASIAPPALQQNAGMPTQSPEVAAMWHKLGLAQSLQQQVQMLGAVPPQVSQWQHTSVRFLGTGSSEPSKYRGPTAILLQVCRHARCGQRANVNDAP